jgi:hypothetical protein
MEIVGTVLTTVKVFTKPTSSSEQLGTITKNVQIKADGVTGTWLHVISPGVVGWVNSRAADGAAGGDIFWKTIVLPPPPPPAGKPMILDIIQITDDNGVIWVSTAPVVLTQKPPILVPR